MTIMPTARQRQNAYRESLRRRGFKRLEITLRPEVFRQLKPFLVEYDPEGHHSGLAVARLLESCARHWAAQE